MAEQKVWMGSPITKCDLCKCQIKNVFVDGKTNMGPWGIMCFTCHRTHGCGLGLGRGQKYRMNDGKWVKVAG